MKPKCIKCGSSDFLEPDPNVYMTIAIDDDGRATGYGCVRCSNPTKTARPALCTCGVGNDPDAWDYHSFDCASSLSPRAGRADHRS